MVDSSKKEADSKLDVAGGTGQAIQNCDTERYAARAADKFTFLRPDRVMDSKKRRPDHPDYDPSTLYIPDNWFKANKISEGQQQWYALLKQAVNLFQVVNVLSMTASAC